MRRKADIKTCRIPAKKNNVTIQERNYLDAQRHGKRQRLCMINTDMLWLSYNIEQRGYLNIKQMEVRNANGTMTRNCIILKDKHIASGTKKKNYIILKDKHDVH